MHLPSTAGECTGNGFLERAIEAANAAGDSFSQRARPSLGKLEEVLQVTYADRLGSR
ncbi:hypothetical protein D3C81_1420520 [compost metagenome]